MRWLFSVSIGINSDIFPERDLRVELSQRKAEDIDIEQSFYPSDGELGILASVVYEESKCFEKIYSLSEKKSQDLHLGLLRASQADRLPEHLYPLFEKWTCIFRFLEQKSGYSGAIYVHETLPQLVIANEGTRTQKHMIADPREIGSLTVGEDTEASAAVALITNLNAILRDFPFYAVSITGHSLGGWLSLVSTFEAAKLGLRAHTVTFDSPGVMPMLLKRQPEVSSGVGIGTLDIRTILSNVNLVNVCHTHAPGTVRVFPPLQGIQGSVDYLKEAHNIRHILNLFDEQGQLHHSRYCIVDNWPSIKPPVRDINDRSLVLFGLRTAYRAAETAIAGGFSEYNAYFKYCEKHFNQYDNPEAGMAILNQGEYDQMAYGSVHYKTSSANPYRCRLASLNEKEKTFFVFLLSVCRIIPDLKTWFETRAFAQLFDFTLQVSLDESNVFESMKERDPQLVFTSSFAVVEEISLSNLINDIRQLLRKYPHAVYDIQTQFHGFLQDTRNKAETALSLVEGLPAQVRQWVEEYLNRLTPGTTSASAAISVSKPATISQVKVALFARRDAYDEEEIYEFSTDEALREARMDALRYKDEARQKTGEEKEAKEPVPEEGITLNDFQTFINNVVEGKNVDRLIVGMRDAYLRRTQLTVRRNEQKESGYSRLNP